jgi:hypothetical protein
MNRPDRRYDGGPHYPLDRVRTCIALKQLTVTRSAHRDAQRLVPPGTVAVFDCIREAVLQLDEDCWQFAQERGGGWVDVYRTEPWGQPVWLKLKVELAPTTKEFAVVVSFHEWDPTRPL